MTLSMVPGFLTPTHTYLGRILGFGLGCGLIGASVMFAATPPTVVQAPPIALTETITVPMKIPTMVTADAMPAPPRVSMVFSAGGASYMKLAELNADKLPRHGKPVLSEFDYTTSAVASIADAEVAPVHRAWRGQEVIVDGTCRATVVDFAIVARLTGDTGYADEDAAGGWTAKSVLRLGAPVLAARLDGCTGELARAASQPKTIVPEVIVDAKLVAAAKKKLFASADMRKARAAWAAWEGEMSPIEHKELDFGELFTQVVRHPTTGETFVSVHATTGGGCGYPDISIWGVYRADQAGTLTRIPTKVGELLMIDGFVDVDGDGQLEVVGRPWLGTERMVSRLDGTVIEKLERPFYGCPC